MIEDVANRDLGHSVFTMLKLSIPITIFVVLSVLGWHLARRSGRQANTLPFLTLVVVAALQSALVSLRWDFGISAVRPAQVFLSCLLPGLAWVSLRSLATARVRSLAVADAGHLLPALPMLFALILAPDAIDMIIIATFVGYGVACLRLAMRGPDALGQVAFEGTLNVQWALYLVTFTLFASAAVDFAVLLDFARGGGDRVPLLIGIGNLIWLAVIGIMVTITTRALPDDEECLDPLTPVNQEPDAEDARIVKLAEDVLVTCKLCKDPNLTLSRLARRCGVPMRHISRAINRIHGKNVSQYVNELRIKDACRLLADTEMTVTAVIYESGFQTKSNFNREFLRVTGKTPRDWRNGTGRSISAPAS